MAWGGNGKNSLRDDLVSWHKLRLSADVEELRSIGRADECVRLMSKTILSLLDEKARMWKEIVAAGMVPMKMAVYYDFHVIRLSADTLQSISEIVLDRVLANNVCLVWR